MANVKDLIRGSLIGGAAGDALGFPIEFIYTMQGIYEKYGEPGIRSFVLDQRTNKALISDDTQMTLYTADAVLKFLNARQTDEKADILDFLTEAYLEWLDTQNESDDPEKRAGCRSKLWDKEELHSRRAPGHTCISALQAIDRGYTARNESKGCGGIMRAAPCGLILPEAGFDEIFRYGLTAAWITHKHPLGYLSSAFFACLIHAIVFSRGERTLRQIVEDTANEMDARYGSDNAVQQMLIGIRKSVELSENGLTDLENIDALGEGWVAEETLYIALYCALRYPSDMDRALVAAVNHVGDSDSTGAVMGNLLGAWLGYDQICKKWGQNLELSETLLEYADRLHELSGLCD